jgi:hypothetical protein
MYVDTNSNNLCSSVIVARLLLQLKNRPSEYTKVRVLTRTIFKFPKGYKQPRFHRVSDKCFLVST